MHIYFRPNNSRGETLWLPSPALPGSGSMGLLRIPSKHSQPSRQNVAPVGSPVTSQNVSRTHKVVNKWLVFLFGAREYPTRVHFRSAGPRRHGSLMDTSDAELFL